MSMVLIPRPDADSRFQAAEGREGYKRHAHAAVRQDLAAGRLVRPDHCERCGRPTRVQAHHYLGYDVEHWTDVEWLCAMCHKRADRQYERHPEDRQTVTTAALRVLKACWGARCCKCGTAERLQWDHIKPVGRGGVHCLGNLQRLCGACNREKRSQFADYRSPEQKAWVFSRVLGSGWRHIARGPYYLPEVVLARSVPRQLDEVLA